MKKGKAWSAYLLATLAAVFIAAGCDFTNPMIDEWWVGDTPVPTPAPTGTSTTRAPAPPPVVEYYTITFKSNFEGDTAGDYIDLVNDPTNINKSDDPPPQKILVGTGTKASEPGLVRFDANNDDQQDPGSYIVGWFIDGNNDGDVDDASDTQWDFATPPDKDLILYPKWASDGYTIKFDLNAGPTGITAANTTYTPLDEYIATGSKLSVPKWFGIKVGDTLDTIVFRGWYKEYTCAPANEWNFDTMTPTEPDDIAFGGADDNTITLYAKWDTSGVPKYKIEFDTDGADSTPEPLYVPQGQKIPVPNVPTKKDNVFQGWYTDDTFTTKYNFDTPPGADVKLYAKWELEPYTDSWFKKYYIVAVPEELNSSYWPFQCDTTGTGEGRYDFGAVTDPVENKANYDYLVNMENSLLDRLKANPSWVVRIVGYEDSPGDGLNIKRELQTWQLLTDDGTLDSERVILNTKLPDGYVGPPSVVANSMIFGPNTGPANNIPSGGNEVHIIVYIP